MKTIAVEQKNDIKITKDYDRFKRIDGNRTLYPAHVKYLTEAFKGKSDVLSYNPVLVNEKMQIIDGQHRVEAAKKLDIPVYYIVRKGLKLKDVQGLNSGTKPWGLMDYAQSYHELGKLDYTTFLDFVDMYPRISPEFIMRTLGRDTAAKFKEGKFWVYDVLKCTQLFDALLELGEFYPKFNTPSFREAFMKMWRHPEYRHGHLIRQLQKNPDAAHPQFDMADYLRELETIYNKDTRPEGQVRFF